MWLTLTAAEAAVRLMAALCTWPCSRTRVCWSHAWGHHCVITFSGEKVKLFLWLGSQRANKMVSVLCLMTHLDAFLFFCEMTHLVVGFFCHRLSFLSVILFPVNFCIVWILYSPSCLLKTPYWYLTPALFMKTVILDLIWVLLVVCFLIYYWLRPLDLVYCTYLFVFNSHPASSHLELWAVSFQQHSWLARFPLKQMTGFSGCASYKPSLTGSCNIQDFVSAMSAHYNIST